MANLKPNTDRSPVLVVPERSNLPEVAETYLRSLKRFGWVILLLACACGLGAYIYEAVGVAPTYQATASDEVDVSSCSAPGICSISVYDSEQYVPTAANLIDTTSVASIAARQLSRSGPRLTEGSLISMTSVSPVPNTQLLHISASSSHPKIAAAVANAMARSAVSALTRTERIRLVKNEQTITSEIKHDSLVVHHLTKMDTVAAAAQIKLLQQQLSSFRRSLNNVSANSGNPAVSMTVTGKALTPSAAIAPRPARTAIVVAALVFAALLAILLTRDYLTMQPWYRKTNT